MRVHVKPFARKKGIGHNDTIKEAATNHLTPGRAVYAILNTQPIRGQKSARRHHLDTTMLQLKRQAKNMHAEPKDTYTDKKGRERERENFRQIESFEQIEREKEETATYK